MITINKDNKNIFQACINLNDNIESLKISREQLLDLNPDYDFHYIKNEEEIEEFMQAHFKNSEDVFEQKIYEVFNCIPSKLDYSEKYQKIKNEEEKKKIHDVCILVSRLDIVRLAVVYKFGGLYYDLSSRVEVDIQKELEKYDCVFLGRDWEIHASICYAKKHSFVIKTILANIMTCCKLKQKLSQMVDLGGPKMITNTILNIAYGIDPNSLDKNGRIERIKDVIDNDGLKKCNSIVFHVNSLPCYAIPATWKRDLHKPDPTNPDFIPNCHWHHPDF